MIKNASARHSTALGDMRCRSIQVIQPDYVFYKHYENILTINVNAKLQILS